MMLREFIHQRSAHSRREFLWRYGGGLGGAAPAWLLDKQGLLAEGSGGADGAQKILETRGPLHRARARRVIQLFMNGGASQMDLFDYKPTLVRHHGEKFNP